MISLKSKITQNILEVFFLNDKEKIYVNEMAKRIRKDPANVHKKLIEMQEEGLLLSEYQGKERFFFLNKKYQFLKEYKKIILKSVGFENALKEEFEIIDGVDSVYLFGSYINSNFSRESDIDILIIGDFDFKKIQKVLLDMQKKIGREINSIELSKKEFKERLKKKDFLLDDIFSKKYIKII
jgi:predicted nucleotidyltransferase